MSVRRQKRTAQGKVREFWIVDIEFRHLDGRTERIRRVPRGGTRAAAEKLEREILNELERGTYGKRLADTPTVEEFAPVFLANYAKNNNKASAYVAKEYILRRHVVPFFGRRRLDAITTLDLERYKSEKQEIGTLSEVCGYSKTSINHHLTTLRTMLRTAKKWGVLDESVRLPDFPMFVLEEPHIEFFDFDEADRLRAEVRKDAEWGPMVVVALDTGLRLGELRALRWQDIDLKAGRLLVRKNIYRKVTGTPKGKRSREVPLNERAMEVLRLHRHLRGPLVFCKEDGSRLSEKMCQRAMERLCRRAQVKGLQWHGLRHTFASHLVMRGVSLKTVQELLGHKDIKETEKYAHLTPAVRREAVEALVAPGRQPGGTASIQEVKTV
jgi:integrase